MVERFVESLLDEGVIAGEKCVVVFEGDSRIDDGECECHDRECDNELSGELHRLSSSFTPVATLSSFDSSDETRVDRPGDAALNNVAG